MRSLLLLFVFASALSACGGASGLRLKRIDSSVQKPSNIAVYFTVETQDGAPVAGLDADSFDIYEDGKLVSVHESKQTILNPEIATEHLTMLLVDMSGSVTESDDVPTIVAGASSFAERLGQYHKTKGHDHPRRQSVRKPHRHPEDTLLENKLWGSMTPCRPL